MAVSVETEPSFKQGKTRELFRLNMESSYRNNSLEGDNMGYGIILTLDDVLEIS